MSFPLFLVPILAGLVAQALKPIFSKDQRDEQAGTLDPRPRYGGMPSAHVAFATSLAVVAGVGEGIDTAIFAIAVALLILVLDDALRLRIFLGRYGIALRHLIRRLPKAAAKELPPIEYRMGHTLPEVLAGMLVGMLTTTALLLLEEALSSPP